MPDCMVHWFLLEDLHCFLSEYVDSSLESLKQPASRLKETMQAVGKTLKIVQGRVLVFRGGSAKVDVGQNTAHKP